MRKLIAPMIALVALIAVGATVFAAPITSRTFHAQLTGAEEVPPRDTPARGHVVLHVTRDGEHIGYLVVVARIQNVVAGHIHCGQEGANGPVGVTLFAGQTRISPIPGLLKAGVISAPDPGNQCGWETIEDVLEAMQSGGTYVNVHTNDGIDPPNTGPGDFPGGEVRGQIPAKNPS